MLEYHKEFESHERSIVDISGLFGFKQTGLEPLLSKVKRKFRRHDLNAAV